MKWKRPIQWGKNAVEVSKEFLGSGPLHRRQLSNIAVRISVSGVRGKSTAVRWLHDIFHDRGYDTYAKVTGVSPVSIYNGTEHDIERSAKVRLYENERELRQFGSIDTAIFENQGIREYTTRLINEQFVKPHVIFLTNVRRDHVDTLGKDRLRIARSLARSVPAGTHVVSGERDASIREYLEAELARRNATITHVEPPEEHRSIPGSEVVYGINPILEAVDEPPISDRTLREYLDRMRVSWTQLPGGRVHNAADANDVQSTELVRRRLLEDSGDVVQPLLYLRADRRGRTANFVDYLSSLADRDAIERARVVGRNAALFDRRTSFPVVTYDETSADPETVLDSALADGWPVLVMGNTVSEFMDGLDAVIQRRARKVSGPSSPSLAASTPLPHYAEFPNR